MKRHVVALVAQVAVLWGVSAAGCAGQLTQPEIDMYCDAHPSNCAGGTGPTTGNPTTGGTTTTGTGTFPDPCITTAMKSCQTVGCHARAADMPTAAVGGDLLLDPPSITSAAYAKTLVDALNKGDTANNGCMAGKFKMIDKSAPEMSLMYTKLTDPVPCGLHMPQIGYPAKAADKACILGWIKAAAMLP